MRRRLRISVVIAFAAASGYVQGAGGQQTAAEAPANASARMLLDKYCVTCHNEKLKTADLMLDKIDVSHVAENPAVWEKVVRRLRSGDMPPAGRPRPDQTTYASVASWLETNLDNAARSKPSPGRVPALQRLTRTEYRNVIRDLFALEEFPQDLDIEVLLPADNAASGFDNLRDLLFVSSTQFEQYLSASRKISRFVIGDGTIPPTYETFPVHGQLPQDGHIVGTPFGARGGTVVRTNLPLNGEYSIDVELAGASAGHQFEISVDGERLELFTIVDPPQQNENPSQVTSASTLKATGSHKFERDQQAARRAAMNRGYKIVRPLKAGEREIIVTFLKRTSAKGDGLVRSALRGRGSQPGVARVTIQGPYNRAEAGTTASRERVFVCRPASTADEARCAKQILSTLMRRAYRRPVTDAEVQTLLPFYEAGKADGGFDRGIQWALERVMVSPRFLFRIEGDAGAAPSSAYRLGDIELASRLSFFLWSSMPDDELLDVAARGRLKDPAVLEQQVRRMLGDPRSQSLVTNFAAQWLFLRDLPNKNPNPRIFRDFDKALQESFGREVELFVDSILREDRSVLELLGARHTFVNERLAKHYGIPNVYGSAFRRVELPEDSPRRGLLGKGAILTLTSYGARTSPVLRGKYVLDNLLSTPPPAPPPNVPALREKENDGRTLTMREAMARHRANAVCASCHARMDPLGFVMENFDAVGQWRTIGDAGEVLDVSATLADGTAVQGIAGLRAELVRRSDQFVAGMTEKLLTYAVGRQMAYYDAPEIRQIVRGAARSDYRFSALVLGVVTSVPFQMRTSSQPELRASHSVQ